MIMDMAIDSFFVFYSYFAVVVVVVGCVVVHPIIVYEMQPLDW